MRGLTSSTIVLCVLFSGGCSSPPPPPPPPQATVFDPLTQQMERARAVQKTVDEHAEKTRDSVDNTERGDTTPP